MPYRCDIQTSPHRTLVTFYDRVDEGEIADAVRAAYTDPAWRGGDAIWDFAGVGDHVSVGPADLAEFTRAADELGTPHQAGRTVLVVTGENAEMVARLYRHLRRGATRTFHIVRTLADAHALLSAPALDGKPRERPGDL